MKDARRLRPDVVLLDVHLSNEDGFEVAVQLTRDAVGSIVVMTSSVDAHYLVENLRQTSPLGFVPKSERLGPELAALVRGTE